MYSSLFVVSALDAIAAPISWTVAESDSLAEEIAEQTIPALATVKSFEFADHHGYHYLSVEVFTITWATISN